MFFRTYSACIYSLLLSLAVSSVVVQKGAAQELEDVLSCGGLLLNSEQSSVQYSVLDPSINPFAELGWVSPSLLERAGLQSRCSTDVCDGLYLQTSTASSLPPAQAPLRAMADRTQVLAKGRTELLGNVDIVNGYRQLHAERVLIDKPQSRMVLQGGVRLQEPGLLFFGDSAEVNTESGLGSMTNARYVLYDEAGGGIRGRAGRLERQADNITTMEDAFYTTCEPNSNAWQLQAKQFIFDQNSGWGYAKNVIIRIKDIPVIYIPYMQFPIDDRRHSGLLWPSFSSTNNGGVDIAQPLYLNLAANYDATITPRFISDRGNSMGLEFRYLGEKLGAWQFGGAYMSSDERFHRENIQEDSSLDSDSSRWIGHIEHRAYFAKGWATRIDYNRSSDRDYLRDLSTTGLEVRRQGFLQQRAELSYRSLEWQFKAEIKEYQSLRQTLSEPYEAVPSLSLSYEQADIFSLNTLFNTEYSVFEHDTKQTGERLYAEAGFDYPMSFTAGFFIPSVKLKHISQQLNLVLNNENSTLVDSAGSSVTVPMINLDSGLYFERDLNIASSDYLQTLEPRLYYLYSDYEQQQDLTVFDTSQLDFSYNQLFRENRFSGHDRLGDANQLSLGISSSLYENDEGRQLLTTNLGQIFYFSDRRVSTGQTEDRDQYAVSEYAASVNYKPVDAWNIHLVAQSDPYNGKMQSGSLRANYNGSNSVSNGVVSSTKNLFNVGYSYRRKTLQLIDDEVVDRHVEQSDISTIWPLNKHWSVIARWNYDLTNKRTIEDLAGLEYDSCCWKVRLLYQREREELASVDVETHYGIHIQIELKKLGSSGGGLDNILRDSVFGYRAKQQDDRFLGGW